jgi:hypothetical protein
VKILEDSLLTAELKACKCKFDKNPVVDLHDVFVPKLGLDASNSVITIR